MPAIGRNGKTGNEVSNLNQMVSLMKITANIDGVRVIGTITDLGLLYGGLGEKFYCSEYAFGDKIYKTSISERECVKHNHGDIAGFRLAWDIQQLADKGVNDVVFGDHEIVTQVKTKPSMSTDDKLDAIMQKLIEMDIAIAELRSTLVSTFQDEFSAGRKAASDNLSKKLLTRMKGEFLARGATAPSDAQWCDACQTAHPADFVCLECLNKRPK